MVTLETKVEELVTPIGGIGLRHPKTASVSYSAWGRFLQRSRELLRIKKVADPRPLLRAERVPKERREALGFGRAEITRLAVLHMQRTAAPSFCPCRRTCHMQARDDALRFNAHSAVK
jgi:hypothetical protein